MSGDLTHRAQAISRTKKERYLLSLSEDRFRDEVVRPLFLRQGLQDGRELCGPTEEGKDALFVAVDQLGLENVYVIQTKKGSMNLAGDASQNAVTAATQLKTALETEVLLKRSRERKLPTKSILCVSGKINQRARAFIHDRVQDPRLEFLDADDLVPAIDEHLPELWFGIDAAISPYLRRVRQILEDQSEDPVSAGGADRFSAASDSMFVNLMIHRTILRPRKHKGRVEQVPVFEEIPVTALASRRQRLVLLLGGAGAGKTTSLRRLAYILATRGLQSDQRPRVPILLRASDLASRSNTSLAQVCQEETRRVTQSAASAFDLTDLQEGRLVILVDALDEVVDQNGRDTVAKLIMELHGRYPACHIILSSRGYTFLGQLVELTAFTSYELSPISYRQAQQILERMERNKSLPVERSQEILRRLEQVHGMELNPLLVTVFAATSEYARRDIPANITELFKKFTEMMLGRWDMAKGFSQQYHAPLKDFILTKLAYDMHQRRSVSIEREEFDAFIKRELETRGHEAEVDQLVEEMLIRSGLFRVLGNTVEFRHHLLQEFFAGRGIPSDEALETMIGDDWWQRAIVFYFGEHPGNGRGLDGMRRVLSAMPEEKLYAASITLGLALQACYLIELADKIGILTAVIDGLSAARGQAIALFGRGERYPLSGFLGYYIFGRDAVACSVVEQKLEEIRRAVIRDGLSTEEKDLRRFWMIVGLIEAGALEEAEALVKRFKPADLRLLLAIQLGCFVIQHLRVTAKEEKRVSERISQSLADQVRQLRPQLLSEVKSELLELRGGKIAALEPEGELEGQ